MTINQHQPENARRRLLKTVAAGVGGATILPQLPSRWTRPVVQSVVLPAHAQSTGLTTFGITCAINSANSTGADSVEVDFTFTLSRSDGQPFPSGFTMDVDFTFSPSGSTTSVLGSGSGGEFSVDGSNTYSAIETLTGTGIGADAEVTMTVAYAISGVVMAGDAGASSCTAGPVSIAVP